MKRYRLITSITSSQREQLIESLGTEFQADLVIKYGFDEGTLPHKCFQDDGLMYLFA
jgi:hypothetical protein